MVHKILRADSSEITGIKNCTYTEAVNAEENVKPGCVSSAMIEAEVYGRQGNAVSSGEALTYYQVVNGVETLIGTFYAQPDIDSRMTFRFKAYDAISKLDVDFSARLYELQSSFPMTIAALVSEAATVAGVTFNSMSFPLASTSINAFYADNITCRQIVSWAAEIACNFVRCRTDGKLEFAWYTEKSGYRIYPNGGVSNGETLIAYRQSGLNYENYAVEDLDGVAVFPADEDETEAVYPSSATGNILNIRNNLLLTGASSATLTSVATNIYDTMSALPSYRPCVANLFPNENPFRAGDIVNVTDVQGVSFKTVVMAFSCYKYRSILKSTGQATYEHQTKENTKNKLLNLASTILRVKALFVEQLEAITARIDTLFAQEITVTGTLHSEDYDKDNEQTYAFNGMGIDFGEKELNATNFALKGDGAFSARAAQIGEFTFIDDGAGSNVVVDTSLTQALDSGGSSTSYGFGTAQYSKFADVYPWQSSRSFGYYTANVDGTFIYSVGGSRNGYNLKYVAVSARNATDTSTPPTLTWKVNGSTLAIVTLKYDNSTTTVPIPILVYNPDTAAIPPNAYTLEVSVSEHDDISVDLIYGNYSAIYYKTKVYGGSGTYVGTDGISADAMQVNGKDVESALPPVPTSAQNGYILKVVNGAMQWVAP